MMLNIEGIILSALNGLFRVAGQPSVATVIRRVES